eukprot:TRINITY_DN4557_c0_g1_i1.p1 TRINITY_DN4557_c0_g1~~TRINITY_DN4557_c0_g1_i1.p1  ORF type:complete len:965 (+),score=229.55 TRINITY_DN4557_c0_g1_i1:64-2958(+)
MSDLRCPLCNGTIGEGSHKCLKAQQKSKGVDEPVEVGSKVKVVNLTTARDLNGAVGMAIGVHLVKEEFRILVKFDPPKQHLDAMMFKEQNVTLSTLPIIPNTNLHKIGSYIVGQELQNEALNGLRGQIVGKQFGSDGMVSNVVEFPEPWGRLIVRPWKCLPSSPMTIEVPATSSSNNGAPSPELSQSARPLPAVEASPETTEKPAVSTTPDGGDVFAKLNSASAPKPLAAPDGDLFANLTEFETGKDEKSAGLMVQLEDPVCMPQLEGARSPTHFDDVPIASLGSMSTLREGECNTHNNMAHDSAKLERKESSTLLERKESSTLLERKESSTTFERKESSSTLSERRGSSLLERKESAAQLERNGSQVLGSEAGRETPQRQRTTTLRRRARKTTAQTPSAPSLAPDSLHEFQSNASHAGTPSVDSLQQSTHEKDTLAAFVLSNACKKLEDQGSVASQVQSLSASSDGKDKKWRPSKKMSSRSNASTCGLSGNDDDSVKALTVAEVLRVGRAMLDEYLTNCSTLQDDVSILVNQSTDGTPLMHADMRLVSEAQCRQVAELDARMLSINSSFQANVMKFRTKYRHVTPTFVDTSYVEGQIVKATREKASLEESLAQSKLQKNNIEMSIEEKTEALHKRQQLVQGELTKLEDEEEVMTEQAQQLKDRIREIHERLEAVKHESSLLLKEREMSLAMLHAERAESEAKQRNNELELKSKNRKREIYKTRVRTAKEEAERMREGLAGTASMHERAVAEQDAKRKLLISRNKMKYNVQRIIKQLKEREKQPGAVAKEMRKVEQRAADIKRELRTLVTDIEEREKKVGKTDIGELEKMKVEAVKRRDFKEAKIAKAALEEVEKMEKEMVEMKQRVVVVEQDIKVCEQEHKDLEDRLKEAQEQATTTPTLIELFMNCYENYQLTKDTPVPLLHKTRVSLAAATHKHFAHKYPPDTLKCLVNEAQTLFHSIPQA